MQLQNFKIFLGPKKGIWTVTNIQNILFFNFFLRFLGVFVPVLKMNLEYLKNKNLIIQF
jgi:hypothetical protein